LGPFFLAVDITPGSGRTSGAVGFFLLPLTPEEERCTDPPLFPSLFFSFLSVRGLPFSPKCSPPDRRRKEGRPPPFFFPSFLDAVKGGEMSFFLFFFFLSLGSGPGSGEQSSFFFFLLLTRSPLSFLFLRQSFCQRQPRVVLQRQFFFFSFFGRGEAYLFSPLFFFPFLSSLSHMPPSCL